jgi:hypothetical protein
MDNPEKLVTLGTQDEDKKKQQNNKQNKKNKKNNNTEKLKDLQHRSQQ